MELTCFIAERLKVNSPNRWDSLKTNLNFKHWLFSLHEAKAAQQQKSCFYHHFLWLIGRKKAIYYPTSFAHINVTINAHRHFTLCRKWGRKKEELEVGELVRGILVPRSWVGGEEREGSGGGGEECVGGGVSERRRGGREGEGSRKWNKNLRLKPEIDMSSFHNYTTLSGILIEKNESHFTSEILSLSLRSLIWKTSRRLWGLSSLSIATPCSIKLACYSQDESPTGVHDDCEVKTPPVPTKSRSGRQKVLQTYPMRVTWQFSPYCLLSHQDLPVALGKWCWAVHKMTFLIHMDAVHFQEAFL